MSKPQSQQPKVRRWRPEPRNISQQLQTVLRDRIVKGELADGSRINEVELSESLEVSRTPLREALSLLCGEGFVHQIPRRGFFVSELSVQEVQELYPIRQILDPEALRLSGLPASEDLSKLRELNQRIAEATEPLEIIELDDEFHLELVSRCGNRILLSLIEQHIDRTRRYEYAYFSSGHHVHVAVEEHELILKALEDGNLKAACTALRRNMTSATEPLLEWLRLRSESEAKKK